jgi:hypothetical protein
VLVGLLAGSSDAKVKRKTFVAREDLLDRLSRVADERGYSLYALVNDLFDLALKADALGLDLHRVLDERGVLETAKRAGFVLALESLCYDMSDLAYEKAKGKALKSWFEAGVWLAKRYVTSGVKDPLEALRRDLGTFMWNASCFSLEGGGDKASVSVFSPRFSEAYTFLLASLFEGLLAGFGYEVAEREVFKGNIRLEAVRKTNNA